MTNWQCKTCKGVYSDEDGYKHACPPIVDRETKETKPRPNARDENWRINKAGRKVIKAEGKGRKKVSV